MYKYMYLENIVAIFKCVIFIEAKRVQGSRINDISNLENKFDANISMVQVVVKS